MDVSTKKPSCYTRIINLIFSVSLLKKLLGILNRIYKLFVSIYYCVFLMNYINYKNCGKFCFFNTTKKIANPDCLRNSRIEFKVFQRSKQISRENQNHKILLIIIIKISLFLILV